MGEQLCKRIRVYGIVQGVGFRPTVSRHAMQSGICGEVSNKGPYVEIIAQGTEAQIDTFLELLQHHPPKRAVILKLDVKPCEEQENPTVQAGAPGYTDFRIVESAKTKGEIFISPDIATCDECREELFDPNNRRYLHPFINCTSCGPRMTILETLPYDRERTSMRAFPMCPTCAEEYHNPKTRRYDAQPVCCNDCGPEVYLVDREERGGAAITEARRVIAAGGIVAVKGIGGFHLCCDATNEAAVQTLRTRKHRPMKPFAVMMRDMETVRELCEVEPAQEELLTGHQKPIILLRKKSVQDPGQSGIHLAAGVAPDNPSVGTMLPYAPVQMLLFDYPDGLQISGALVMTSGNVSGAPICKDDDSVKQELGTICDCILSHNREIRTRADDSVTDFFEGQPYMIRRSRGYAPLPVLASHPFTGQATAIGGELKNTFCIASGSLFYPSSYIGDLADLRTVDALQDTLTHFEELLEVKPSVYASDLHPRYNATVLAGELAGRDGVPCIRVQHHYAHIVSCMAENDYEEKVIGVSFDGTGYGTDGTIWGGEILLADWHGFSRAASIYPFTQVGGDASSREGWRIAAAMMADLYEPEEAVQRAVLLHLCEASAAKAQLTMAKRQINAVQSTSAGRLFDAVSAILGIRTASTFEGEASMTLQFAAEQYLSAQTENCGDGCCDAAGVDTDMDRNAYGTRYAMEKHAARGDSEADPAWRMRTDLLVEDLIQRKLAGEDAGKLAWVFHRELAAMIVAAVCRISEETGIRTAALSGGCFQNTLLLGLVKHALEETGMQVLIHHLIPPNDGGIALGQAVAAMQQMEDRKRKIERQEEL